MSTSLQIRCFFVTGWLMHGEHVEYCVRTDKHVVTNYMGYIVEIVTGMINNFKVKYCNDTDLRRLFSKPLGCFVKRY